MYASVRIIINIEEKKEILAKEDGLFETPGASLMNYDEKVSALMEKNDWSWMCKVCPYNSNHKQHLTEHVGKHIKGYSFDCKFCHKSHHTKAALRFHVGKCISST